jgi:hypothetical protein
MTLFQLVDFGVFVGDAFDEPLFFHEVEAVLHMVGIRDEQWITPDQRDADLDG